MSEKPDPTQQQLRQGFARIFATVWTEGGHFDADDFESSRERFDDMLKPHSASIYLAEMIGMAERISALIIQ